MVNQYEFSEEGPRGIYATCALLFAAGILARLLKLVFWCLHSPRAACACAALVGLHPTASSFARRGRMLKILPALEEGLRMRGFPALDCRRAQRSVRQKGFMFRL